MNYRHVYHAGNFADVFKHLILTLLLQALARKQAPFVYIDTHAGAGRYDLQSPPAAKTAEHQHGIGRVWECDDPPGALPDYVNVIRALNPDGVLRFYPGSPSVAHALRRATDRIVLAEQQPDECRELQTLFAGARRVSIHCQDGLAGLKGWLPPPERRGLVLIDPPYERDAEWDEVVAALALAYRRWSTGCYALWYPIKARAPLAHFIDALAAIGFDQALRTELLVCSAETPFRLNGCGMVIVNPPWKLDETIAAFLPWLGNRLRQGPGGGGQVYGDFLSKTI